MEDARPPRSQEWEDTPISEARERVRQMRVDVEQNRTLLARTSALIQRLTDLLVGKPIQ